MAELRPEAVAVTSLVAVEGFKAFKDVLPSITEVRRRHADDAGFRAELRAAEALASAVVLVSSVSVTAITDNQAPLYIGLATIGVMLFVYEGALARPAPGAVEAVAVEVEPA